MELKLNELKVEKLNQSAKLFGNSQTLSLWISPETIAQVSLQIKADPELGLNWLENLSVQQRSADSILTYFFRSTENRNTLVIKTKVETHEDARATRIASICAEFPMARFFEEEISRQAGFDFADISDFK